MVISVRNHIDQSACSFSTLATFQNPLGWSWSCTLITTMSPTFTGVGVFTPTVCLLYQPIQKMVNSLPSSAESLKFRYVSLATQSVFDSVREDGEVHQATKFWDVRIYYTDIVEIEAINSRLLSYLNSNDTIKSHWHPHISWSARQSQESSNLVPELSQWDYWGLLSDMRQIINPWHPWWLKSTFNSLHCCLKSLCNCLWDTSSL